MTSVILTHEEIYQLASKVADAIRYTGIIFPRVYAIPRGGIPVAYAVRSLYHFEIVDDPAKAEIFLDDIIDSGETMRKYCDAYPGTPFFALVDRTDHDVPENLREGWIVFPWETSEEKSIEDNIRRLIQYTGDDPARGGLLETPKRVAKAWREWCSGYTKDPASVLKVFEDGAEGCDEMILVRDIPVYSHCEHHLAPIFGTAAIAYIPDGSIVGLSKLSRIVDVFARRLQVQERLTNQIADSLNTHLKPKGVAVSIKARHLCMESRGINRPGTYTITSALHGVIRSDEKARAEFYSMIKA